MTSEELEVMRRGERAQRLLDELRPYLIEIEQELLSEFQVLPVSVDPTQLQSIHMQLKGLSRVIQRLLHNVDNARVIAATVKGEPNA